MSDSGPQGPLVIKMFVMTHRHIRHVFPRQFASGGGGVGWVGGGGMGVSHYLHLRKVRNYSKQNSIDLDEAAHYGPPHLDKCCL